MAPSHSRQLLIWTLPTIAVLFSYLWYKRKRIVRKTDPGDTPQVTEKIPVTPPTPIAEKSSSNSTTPCPNRPFSRSLSGVDSAPIDIVIPPKLKGVKSYPVVISDEDLDFEIEKIKSMRYGCSIDMRKSNSSGELVNEVSVQEQSPVIAQTPIAEEKVQVQQCKIEEKSPGSIEVQRQNSERDSANHSPADVMLASPCLSSISDNHSEGSNDSGKGGSDVVTPPPSRSLGAESASNLTVYEFIISSNLVGKLIGKQGRSLYNIKKKTGAHIIVRRHPSNYKLKVCVIEGTQSDIDMALKLIREKFPLKHFPELTLQQVTILGSPASTVTVTPECFYVKLIEGINNDTIVSCVMAPNHLFLQQPTHPSFPNLNIMNTYINACYSEVGSPLLPTPIADNTICVALSGSAWYRAFVLSTDVESGTCYVKFLDYGGYQYVDVSNLRQIRGDFMMLPFQAAECFLANIKPVNENGWMEEAFLAVAELTKNAIIFTQIVDYTEDEIPLVYCYLLLGPNHVVFLNQELVNQGHAEWLGSGDEASGVTVA